MVIETRKLAELHPAEYNPRKALKPGDAEYEKLKRSLSEFGFVEPLIWNRTTGNVVGGHQRLTVLADLGYTEAECVVVELDEHKEKALNVALNKIQGAWDTDKLAALLSDLDASAYDVTLTGFDSTEIDELMNQFYAKEAVEDQFDADAESEAIKAKGAITKPGDIWQLGSHLLMCGDSGSAEDFAKLLKGDTAQLAVTTPPTADLKEYQTDGIGPWLERMRKTAENLAGAADIVCWNLGDMYSTGTQFVEPTSVHSVNLFRDAGLRPIWIRIWHKTRMEKLSGGMHLTSNKPHAQYDFITAFGKQPEPEYNDQEFLWLSAYAGHSYKFVKRLSKDERKKWGYSGIWEMPAAKQSKSATAMPVELPWRCIKMHSDRGGIVLEPFCGHGTTLIACEQTERVCRAMDIDPYNCDLTVRRWEEFTGQKAVLL